MKIESTILSIVVAGLIGGVILWSLSKVATATTATDAAPFSSGFAVGAGVQLVMRLTGAS
jgi:hypothetical protein